MYTTLREIREAIKLIYETHADVSRPAKLEIFDKHENREAYHMYEISDIFLMRDGSVIFGNLKISEDFDNSGKMIKISTY